MQILDAEGSSCLRVHSDNSNSPFILWKTPVLLVYYTFRPDTCYSESVCALADNPVGNQAALTV